MAKQYQWRIFSNIISGGFAGEDTGVIPPETGWKTTATLTGSASAQYYYRDSDVGQNENSSRVVYDVEDKWEVSFNSKNFMHVKVTTVIHGIRRDDIKGTPAPYGDVGRHIWVRREDGGQLYYESPSDPISNAHDIYTGDLNLGTLEFDLPPGQDATRSSVWVRNTAVGFEDRPIPNEYTDILGIGVQFKNILPPDYRPGDVRYGGHWKSTNRDVGKCHIRQGGQWVEMRTIDGGSGTNDPPKRRSGGVWKNQYLIGEES